MHSYSIIIFFFSSIIIIGVIIDITIIMYVRRCLAARCFVLGLRVWSEMRGYSLATSRRRHCFCFPFKRECTVYLKSRRQLKPKPSADEPLTLNEACAWVQGLFTEFHENLP